MALRMAEKGFHKLERVVRIALAALFLWLEIGCIYVDRTVSAKHEEWARTEDRFKFQELIDQGDRINQRQREAQKKQMRRFRALLSQGEKVRPELRRGLHESDRGKRVRERRD